MNYRETLRAVRAFLGWAHIPDFEYSAIDGNRCDNPWKGKHPRKMGKISVELPADDWLCHKMEKLNIRVAGGYSSRSQTSLTTAIRLMTRKTARRLVTRLSHLNPGNSFLTRVEVIVVGVEVEIPLI